MVMMGDWEGRPVWEQEVGWRGNGGKRVELP